MYLLSSIVFLFLECERPIRNLRHQIQYLGTHLTYLALVLQGYAVAEQDVVESDVVLVVGLFKLFFQSFDGIYCFSLSILYFVVQHAPRLSLNSIGLPHWMHGNPTATTPFLTTNVQVSVYFLVRVIKSFLVIFPAKALIAKRPLHPHLADYPVSEFLTTLRGQLTPRADIAAR